MHADAHLCVQGQIMARKRRAMTSAQASSVKRSGHANERDFAKLIGGKVVGKKTDKKDVEDRQGNNHSVKGGEWWQVFLYGRDRFVTNTEFQGMGNVAELMIACLDAFPETRSDYELDRVNTKHRLQEPMRELCAEIRKPCIFPELLSKGIFNNDEVSYLSILTPCLSNKLSLNEKRFHIFSQDTVVGILASQLEIRNSKARTGRAGEMDDQKVIFRYGHKNVGEIEVRTDSIKHYREMKWRFQACGVFPMLDVLERFSLNQNIYVRGSARNTFSL